MSIRITIACEDHTLDQYVARPVLSSLLAYLSRPRADVRAITSPRIQGISDLKAQLCAILERYSVFSNLVVFVIDGDCEDGRSGKLDRHVLFQRLASKCDDGEQAVIVVARQELEVWALWGSRSKLGVPWGDVVDECHPKERFFEPLVTPADRKMPGRGRQRLIALSLDQGWQSLCSGCPELKGLEDQVRTKLGL